MPGSTVTTIPGARGFAGFAGIVNVQADVVAEAVNVVLAEPFTMQILAWELI